MRKTDFWPKGRDIVRFHFQFCTVWYQCLWSVPRFYWCSQLWVYWLKLWLFPFKHSIFQLGLLRILSMLSFLKLPEEASALLCSSLPPCFLWICFQKCRVSSFIHDVPYLSFFPAWSPFWMVLCVTFSHLPYILIFSSLSNLLLLFLFLYLSYSFITFLIYAYT